MAVVGGLVAFALVGCGPTGKDEYGDISGVEEIAQPLSALGTPPAFTSSSGALAITMADTELAIISKHAVNGNILVNDVVTTGATATTVKSITVTGSSGVNTVILDFANGTFAPGTTAGPGITLSLAAGADVFKIRGVSTTADIITYSGTSLATVIGFNTDSNDDIAVGGTGTIAHTLSLGGGNDVFDGYTGGYGCGGNVYSGAVTVYAGLGDDTLLGGTGVDTFYGDLGNDTFNAGSVIGSGDVYNGGGGTDTVTYASRTNAVTVTIGATADDGESGENDDIKSDVEVVRGGSGDDTMTSGTGNETLYGGAGNDTFLNGTTPDGADTFYGEAGTDTVSYASRTAAVTVTMDSNVANDGESTDADNVRDDVENLICPTAAVVCTVTGNALNNTITGGAGADVLSGGAGDDTFVEGINSGIGQGADTIAGGTGIDTVDFSAYAAAATITLDGVACVASKVIGTDVENITCPTGSACTATGNASANRIIGSSVAETINGGAGDDFIESNGGNDTVDCGDGSDILYVSGGTVTATNCEL